MSAVVTYKAAPLNRLPTALCGPLTVWHLSLRGNSQSSALLIARNPPSEFLICLSWPDLISVLCNQITLTLQKTNTDTHSNQPNSSIIKTPKQKPVSQITGHLEKTNSRKDDQDEQTEKLTSQLTEAPNTVIIIKQIL